MNDTNEESRMLRILFVTSDRYPPFRPAARAIFKEEIPARGHTVDWIMQAEKNWPQSKIVEYSGGRFYVCGTDDGESAFARIRKHLWGFFYDFRVFAIVRRGNYDLVQIKDKYFGALLSIIAARLNQVPAAYWLAYPHAESWLQDAREGRARYRIFYYVRGWVFKVILYRVILTAVDHIFVQSEQMKRDIAAQGIPEEKMTPVPSSVNLEDEVFRNVGTSRVPRELAQDERHLVYLGLLAKRRRLDFLVRVLAIVLKRYPEAKLYLVGAGELPDDEAFLETECEHYGVKDAVVMTGQLEMADALGLAKGADVCLSPYYPTPELNSTSPTKLVEYMALGRPVVANDHPEQTQVLQASRAGICVPWDEEAYANAIVEILNDPDEATRMGDRGRKFVEAERTNQHMTDVVLENLSKMVGKNTGADPVYERQ